MVMADALGLTVPPMLLTRAEEAIERADGSFCAMRKKFRKKIVERPSHDPISRTLHILSQRAENNEAQSPNLLDVQSVEKSLPENQAD
jgi:hypothetical protein